MKLPNLNAWWGGSLGAAAVVSAAVGFAPAPPSMVSLAGAEALDRQLVERGAVEYAPDEYGKYREAVSRARKELQDQRNTLYFARQYRTFDRMSREALDASAAADRAAVENRRSVQMEVNARRREVREMTSSIRGRLSRVSISDLNRARLTRAEVLLREADMLADSAEWNTAAERVSDALRLVRAAGGEQQERLDRFSDAGLVRRWDRWVRETLAESDRSGSKAIVVVKSRAMCLLVSSGRIVRTYRADFGKNSVFDKSYRGDEATPEGKYRVVSKKGIGQSKYHKALLIDYPNADDMREFRRMRARGGLTPKSMLGGLIEIHGGGGRDQNWTQGCVALANTDMDDIFRRVELGVPVTIVGSYSDYDRMVRSKDNS